jgi:protein-S-isoprenylcysteine O-methyltransferase Ste14
MGRLALTRRIFSTALGATFLFFLLVYWPHEVREANRAWGWPVWEHPLGRVAGVLLILAGAGLVGYSMALMVRRGAGTPVPTDPPTRLVVSGPFRRSRNPIYIGYLAVVLGEALLFGQAALYLYVLVCLAFFELTILGYEEPRLRRRFGAAYEGYAREVPRWVRLGPPGRRAQESAR